MEPSYGRGCPPTPGFYFFLESVTEPFYGRGHPSSSGFFLEKDTLTLCSLFVYSYLSVLFSCFSSHGPLALNSFYFSIFISHFSDFRTQAKNLGLSVNKG